MNGAQDLTAPRRRPPDPRDPGHPGPRSRLPRADAAGSDQPARQRLTTTFTAFLREAARVPSTWFVLLVVPVVFVRVAAPALSDAARLLAGQMQPVPIDAVAAGWSAAFVTALAGFFQVFEGRTVDRRLALAGMPAAVVAAGRLATGLMVAAVATTASLLTLSTGGTGTFSARAVVSTGASAVVYLALGMGAGVVARTAVGGVTTILFVWILDTFFGPAMNGTTSPVMRALPLHYVTLWLLGFPTGHGGPAPWLGVLAWVVTALLVATATLVLLNRQRPRARHRHRHEPARRLGSTPTLATPRPDVAPFTADSAARAGHRTPAPTPSTATSSTGAGPSGHQQQARQGPPVDGGPAPERDDTRSRTHRPGLRIRTRAHEPRWFAMVSAGGRDMVRTPTLWSLLVIVPGIFIVLAAVTTPHGREAIRVIEAGRSQTWLFDPAVIHAGTMAPVAIAALSMLVGVYVAADTRSGDQRLGWAGMPPIEIAGTRVALAACASATVTAVSMAVTAALFTPAFWSPYVVGNALLGFTYASLGVLMGARTGRVTGTFLAFLLPFLDVGLSQSPMLRAEPPLWAAMLPGSSSTRVLLDGALTPGFDRSSQLLLAAGWAVVTAALAGAAVWHAVGVRHHRRALAT